MNIREIAERDNQPVEQLIRTCLKEFGADKPGTAWSDPDLGRFHSLYQKPGSRYWVVEQEGKIVAGCGIGPIPGHPEVCELQKMYAAKDTRGTGIAHDLLQTALTFARRHYRRCYLETLSSMAAANRFYLKNGFRRMDKPLSETEHYACDVWYIKDL
ncbi:GNAT family N-acetyltransferase [Terribacillus sp. 7520-G]|uniref:GNAT family N-acetyltransferase n=1 Tax=Terribacillus TaxID=459532 RepID=UPI000BA7A3B3|nr:GNAT family N-acetyltransferase [Terribacillus sp. 7520-G]PAD37785.1 GNAT family N-acetyltransferase [Terribacillus sp. 7520-G]